MPRVKHEWTDASGWSADYVAKNWPMFSFGSNLDVMQLQRRAPNATFVSTARINHARLWFVGHTKTRGTGVATLRPTTSHEGYAMGVLFKMTTADIKNMDRFEANGVAYRRTLVTVTGPKGKPVRAFTYLHTSQKVNAPAPQYVTTITAGYRFWGFDVDLLRAAVKRSPESNEPKSFAQRQASWVNRDTLPMPAVDGWEPEVEDEYQEALSGPVVQSIGPLEYRRHPAGGYVATARYTPPAGRPRSTPPAKAFKRDGSPLNEQPQDCDCPNYRKTCTWHGCPRFDNRDLAGEGK
jgi:hypothetical protein